MTTPTPTPLQNGPQQGRTVIKKLSTKLKESVFNFCSIILMNSTPLQESLVTTPALVIVFVSYSHTTNNDVYRGS